METTQKFIDLHIHTKYTKGNGITEISELLLRAKELTMDSLAIVDSGTISGIPEFYNSCVNLSIKPILGLGFYFTNESRFSDSEEKYHLVLLAENSKGFENLVTLAELSFTEGFCKRPRIDFELLGQYSEGLICLTGGLGGLIDKLLLAGKQHEAFNYCKRFLKIFGKENFFIELQDNEVPQNQTMMELLPDLAKELNCRCVVSGGSFYLNRESAEQCNRVREENGNRPLKGSGYYFKSPTEIISKFHNYEDAITNSSKIAERCNVILDSEKLTAIDYECNSDLENILAIKESLR